jgi:GalNAc-alpha-(1->4)-GalNAc-alpha-(1->3)-diNAcBac-PP-undecaprenol alpha-1,4-N-acetyl-D-galactosaminyltransferase
MRILFFISKLYGGGAERVATILLSHFCEKHDTYVAINNFDAPFYPLDSRTHIIDNRLNGIWVKIVPQFLKTAFTIKKANPDIIISFLVSRNNRALLANLLCRKKIIVSERIALSHETSYKQKILRYLLYPTADKIVFVTTEDCIKFGLPHKSLTIYNPNMLTPIHNYENRQKTIITVGPTKRWYQKGFDLLINAWAKISMQFPDWNLEILGRYNANELPEHIPHPQSVSWIGWSANIADILQTKSIFVLASRFEGCPNSLIEAMSQGCACIVTDCDGGMKEMITNGVDGLIAKNENVDDIAEKLQMLIDDEKLRCKLSAEAIEKAKLFDKNTFFAQWDNLLEEVAGK